MKTLLRPSLAALLAGLTLAVPLVADTVDDQLTRLLAADAGQSNAASVALAQHVARTSGDPAQRASLAARFAALLTAENTPPATRTFLAQQLRLVAGDAEVPRLARMLGDPSGTDLACLVLRAIPTDAASKALLAALPRLEGRSLLAVINLLGERQDAPAVESLTRQLTHPDPTVVEAAAAALGKIGTPTAARALASAQVATELLPALQHAQLTAAQRLTTSGHRAEAAAICRRLGTDGQTPAIRVAAITGLANAAGDDAIPALRDAFQNGAAPRPHLALDRLRQLGTPTALDALKSLLPGAVGTTRCLLLGALAEHAHEAALVELTRLAAGSDSPDRTDALRELRRLTWTVRDPLLLARLQTTTVEPESAIEVLSPAPYPASVIAARRGQVAGSLGTGQTLLAYLDAGVAARVQEAGLTLRQVNGGAWRYPGADQVAPPPLGTVAFDGNEIAFEISGLDPAKHYSLGFSWWDYDHNGRVQSVLLIGGEPVQRVSALPATPLPAYEQSRQSPVIGTVPIAPSLVSKGKLRVAFQRRAASNAVVSELWIAEHSPETAGSLGATLTGGDVLQPPARTVPTVDLTPPAEGTRVLLVTGIDYPGHPWRETAPALKAILDQDPRFKTRIVEDPNALASPKLQDWDIVIIHFMDWEIPGPGPEARENLRRFVAGGKGLMLTHFACGAWDGNEWPEFARLAGRVWDPKLRGHDPHGTFRVEIADPDHPITRGLAPFDTLDELYTCLTGDTPIHIVAKARSKVDGLDYPMAFVLDYGQGRVFHTVLGHDARAYAAPGVGQLLRRACAWTARLSGVSQ
jgi:type 1 glutamine amidotransferase/HEAT repeat protein